MSQRNTAIAPGHDWSNDWYSISVEFNVRIHMFDFDISYSTCHLQVIATNWREIYVICVDIAHICTCIKARIGRHLFSTNVSPLVCVWVRLWETGSVNGFLLIGILWSRKSILYVMQAEQKLSTILNRHNIPRCYKICLEYTKPFA